MSDKFLTYANDVISGKILACNLIILACKRYLEWFNRKDIYFDEKKAEKAVNFIQMLKHYQGKAAGKYFILEEWQKWIVYNIFGWYWRETNLRVTTKAFILVARKNGKSAFASALCLYGLLADGEQGAQVLNVANNREQGKLLFDMETKFLQSIDPKKKHTQIFRDRIKYPKTNSYSRCLSSDSSGLDGLSASFYVCDETHEYKDSKLWDVLLSSQGYRTQPLAIQISTAGFNIFGFCANYRKMCVNILNGLSTDDTQFSAIYELDDDDDWKDEKNWIKCNPNLDVTAQRKYLRDMVTMATNNSSEEVNILTKNFNKWVQSKDIWISDKLINEHSKDINIEDYRNEICYMGVDLSCVSDMTAVSVMIPHEDKFLFKTWYYLPESCLIENSNAELYKYWKRKGFLKTTPQDVIDYDYILKDILNIADVLNIKSIQYDAYNATQWAINATEEGLNLEPFSQALWSFNQCTKEFERALKLDKVIIDNNEITRWCFANVALKFDHNNNVKPVKGGDKQQKIDGVIAMLQAFGGYLKKPNTNFLIG